MGRSISAQEHPTQFQLQAGRQLSPNGHPQGDAAADPEYLSFAEAVHELRLKAEDLKRLVSEGEIRAYRDGTTLKLRRRDIETLRTELRGGAAAERAEPSELVFEDDTHHGSGSVFEPAPPRFTPGSGPALLTTLRRGLPTIVIVATLVTAATAAAVLLSPPLYEAESRLIVRMGREYLFRPDGGAGEIPRAPSLSEMVNSEVEILSGRDLAEQVVRSIGVSELYPELLDEEPDAESATGLAVPRFRSSTSIRPVLDSSVIKVAFEHRLPEIAARAVNLLVDRFQEKHLEVFGEDRSDALERQWEQRVAELAEAEATLAHYRERYGVFDLAEQRRLLLERGLTLEQELLSREQELAELPAVPASGDLVLAPVELPAHLAPGMEEVLLRQRHELEQELRAMEPVLPDQLVREASLRLLELELQETELLRDYSESNRKVQSVRAGIQQIREFLVGAEDKASSYDEAKLHERAAVTATLESEIARLNGEIELLVRQERQRVLLEDTDRRRTAETACQDLRVRHGQVAEDLRALDGHEQTLRTFEREATAAAVALEQCRDRLNESRLNEHLDREKQINVRVIERAVPPAVPGGLPASLKLGLGAFAGLIAGVGLALFTDVLRTR